MFWPIFASALISAVTAVEISPGGLKYDFDGDLAIPLSFGTPPQTVKVSFNSLAGPFSEHPLEVYSKVFDGTSSSTFKRTHNITGGYHGTDVVEILGTKLTNVGIDVKLWLDPAGKFGLSRGTRGEKLFVETLLEKLDGDRAVVLRIVDSSRSGSHKGSLIFGQRQPVGCSSDWKVFKAHRLDSEQFLIDLDKVEIGKYENHDKLTLGFSAQLTDLESAVYRMAESALPIHPSKQISCGTRTPIVLKAGDLEWSLGPEEYSERNGGTCRFTIYQSRITRLPLRFLKGHCLRYDYELNTTSIAKLI